MKTLNFKLILIGLLIGISTTAFAQEKPHSNEKKAKMENKKAKMDAILVGFITTELELTTQEAQVFWPVWNKYHAEMEVHNQKLKQLAKGNQEKAATLSDKDAESSIQTMLSTESAITATRQKYVKDFSASVGSKKTLKFFTIERKFQQRVAQEMRKQKQKQKGAK